jgi:hypothetical protein
MVMVSPFDWAMCSSFVTIVSRLVNAYGSVIPNFVWVTIGWHGLWFSFSLMLTTITLFWVEVVINMFQ